MKKRKGNFSLLEALEFLEETTYSGGYPDDGIGGVAGDDDRPPGNIVYGEKYKRTPYFNKLTTFQDSWEVDNSDWTWDEFENSQGMEDFINYHNSLDSMKDLFPKEVWYNIWKRMKNVPDDLVTLRFKKALQPYRKAKDQLGADKEDHIEVKTTKNNQNFKKSEIKKESSLTKRINSVIL